MLDITLVHKNNDMGLAKGKELGKIAKNDLKISSLPGSILFTS